MKNVEDNQTIKIFITYGTLKKIVKSGILTKDEYLNLILNGVQISKYMLSEQNDKIKVKNEKIYEKNKNNILHKKAVRKMYAEARMKKMSKRKINREG